MFDPFSPTMIMGVIFAGVMGIIWMSNKSKIARMKVLSHQQSPNGEVVKEISILRQENKDLRRRIETLEAIIIDSDMKLMTGMDSDLALRESGLRDQRKDEDLTI